MIPIETTKNYALPKWKKSDFIQMDDFNDAFAKLDAALKAGADATAAEAAQRASAVAALTCRWDSSKVCRIALGSYTGTGDYGESKPNRIQCGFTPALLVFEGGEVLAIRGQTIMRTERCTNTLTWGSNGVSWYVNEYTTASDQGQLNQAGTVYRYLILGYDA